MNKNLTILCIGDIVGKLGRAAINELVPKLRRKHNADLIIANCENAAHGKGITPITAQELLDAGIDMMTTGDHCFDQASSVEACFNSEFPILRPLNYTAGSPGEGFAIAEVGDHEVLLINLIGRSFMPKHYDCPFRAAQAILERFTDKKFSAIIIDIHAETTAEKIALRHFLDGKVSALLGTHTHVQTADNQITAKGTGYITDLGMTGDADGVIGIAAEPIVASFLTQTKINHELRSEGRAQLNGVKLSVDPVSGRCLEIDLIHETLTVTS